MHDTRNHECGYVEPKTVKDTRSSSDDISSINPVPEPDRDNVGCTRTNYANNIEATICTLSVNVNHKLKRRNIAKII